jgi:hypothetical protein
MACVMLSPKETSIWKEYPVNQTVSNFTLLVTALTLLVIAVTVLLLLWSASRIPANRSVEKRFAYQWLPLLGTILRAAGNVLRNANNRQIHHRKEKRKQISDTTDQRPP